jgi:hypothetical protein
MIFNFGRFGSKWFQSSIEFLVLGAQAVITQTQILICQTV